jgi:histidinol-phosphate aminotransferase
MAAQAAGVKPIMVLAIWENDRPFPFQTFVTQSRRTFLHSLGLGTAAGLLWPVRANPRPITFHPTSGNSAAEGLIRLNSNENAYGPSPKVTESIVSVLGGANRYPRMQYGSLREHIAAGYGIKPEQVILGCGSTEILRMAASAFLGNGKRLIHAVPTFEAIQHYATAMGSEPIGVHLTSAFAHDLDGMLSHVDANTGLIYICNPNNPTASLTQRKHLEEFIDRAPISTPVIIDEAYHHYAGQSGTYASFIDHPLEDDRIIVTRTFSKVYGLAGLRVGYGIASPKIVEQMQKFSTEDNINGVATAAAVAALKDVAGTSQSVQRNANNRQEFFNQAMARALKPIDSHANFVMMNTYHPASEVLEHFRTHNILLGRVFPSMNTYIRVSLGTSDEMMMFWRTWDMIPWSKNIMHH